MEALHDGGGVDEVPIADAADNVGVDFAEFKLNLRKTKYGMDETHTYRWWGRWKGLTKLPNFLGRSCPASLPASAVESSAEADGAAPASGFSGAGSADTEKKKGNEHQQRKCVREGANER